MISVFPNQITGKTVKGSYFDSSEKLIILFTDDSVMIVKAGGFPEEGSRLDRGELSDIDNWDLHKLGEIDRAEYDRRVIAAREAADRKSRQYRLQEFNRLKKEFDNAESI